VGLVPLDFLFMQHVLVLSVLNQVSFALCYLSLPATTITTTTNPTTTNPTTTIKQELSLVVIVFKNVFHIND